MSEDSKPKGKSKKGHAGLIVFVVGLVLGIVLGWLIGVPGWFDTSVRQPIFGAAQEQKSNALQKAGEETIKMGEKIKDAGKPAEPDANK